MLQCLLIATTHTQGHIMLHGEVVWFFIESSKGLVMTLNPNCPYVVLGE